MMRMQQEAPPAASSCLLLPHPASLRQRRRQEEKEEEKQEKQELAGAGGQEEGGTVLGNVPRGLGPAGAIARTLGATGRKRKGSDDAGDDMAVAKGKGSDDAGDDMAVAKGKGNDDVGDDDWTSAQRLSKLPSAAARTIALPAGAAPPRNTQFIEPSGGHGGMCLAASETVILLPALPIRPCRNARQSDGGVEQNGGLAGGCACRRCTAISPFDSSAGWTDTRTAGTTS